MKLKELLIGLSTKQIENEIEKSVRMVIRGCEQKADEGKREYSHWFEKDNLTKYENVMNDLKSLGLNVSIKHKFESRDYYLIVKW